MGRGVATGPIVVLDLDRGDLRVLCDDAAQEAARAWARLVEDPDHHGVMCTPEYRCRASCDQVALHIELDNTERPQIRSVVVGRKLSFAYYVHAFSQLRAHPECPSRPLRQLHR